MSAWVLSCSAYPQQFPSKPIRLVLAQGSGGATDAIARPIAQRLSEAVGQPVVVDNRPGAGGNLGAEMVARSAPDGHTILMAATPFAINATLYAGRITYDPLKDFTPITLVAKVPVIVAVHPSLPARSLQEFIALAKKRPGALNYGSPGPGTANHLVGEMLKSAAGIDMTHVPYRGGALAIAAVLSGDIEAVITPPPSLLPLVKAGRLRALAISSAERSAVMPEVPSVAESGVPGFDATSWFCFVGPAGLPAAVVEHLNTRLTRILGDATFKQRMAAMGADVQPSTPDQLHEFLHAEIPKWGRAVRASGAKAD